MFAAGVPLVEGLESVSGATGNIVYENACLEIKDEVATGSRLQQVIRTDRRNDGSTEGRQTIHDARGLRDALAACRGKRSGSALRSGTPAGPFQNDIDGKQHIRHFGSSSGCPHFGPARSAPGNRDGSGRQGRSSGNGLERRLRVVPKNRCHPDNSGNRLATGAFNDRGHGRFSVEIAVQQSKVLPGGFSGQHFLNMSHTIVRRTPIWSRAWQDISRPFWLSCFW